MPDAPFFCPVCERPIEAIWLWQQPDSARIRLFCEACAQTDEYRDLPLEQRSSLGRAAFEQFAGRRLLEHVLEREREKRAGASP